MAVSGVSTTRSKHFLSSGSVYSCQDSSRVPWSAVRRHSMLKRLQEIAGKKSSLSQTFSSDLNPITSHRTRSSCSISSREMKLCKPCSVCRWVNRSVSNPSLLTRTWHRCPRPRHEHRRAGNVLDRRHVCQHHRAHCEFSAALCTSWLVLLLNKKKKKMRQMNHMSCGFWPLPFIQPLSHTVPLKSSFTHWGQCVYVWACARACVCVFVNVC